MDTGPNITEMKVYKKKLTSSKVELLYYIITAATSELLRMTHTRW